MTDFLIAPPTITQEGDYAVLSASVITPGSEMTLAFRAHSDANLTITADPFFAACLIPAMALGTPLDIADPVSPDLLSSAQLIQNIFHNWFPELKRIPISAGCMSKPRKLQDRVGCFFSGGVDSLHSFLKHRHEITSLVYVHGFDVALADIPLRKKVSSALQAFASQTGKELIEVESNLRELTDQYGGWGPKMHGPALASVGLLLDSRMKRVYIPSSYAYSELHPWASHPLVDPLWSTDTIQFIHDGCESTRFEKVASIANDDRALSTLRVCWENRNGSYNCGACEKCIRTMTALEILGVLHKCLTFSNSLDLELVRQFDLKNDGEVLFWKDNYNAAVKHNRHDIAAALKTALDQFNTTEALKALGNQFKNITNHTNFDTFVLRYREDILLSLLNSNRDWTTREVIKENIKRLLKIRTHRDTAK